MMMISAIVNRVITILNSTARWLLFEQQDEETAFGDYQGNRLATAIYYVRFSVSITNVVSAAS